MSEQESKEASKENFRKTGVIPYLLSSDGLKHIEWLKAVFGAKLENIFYRDKEEKKVMHSALTINEGTVFLADADEEHKEKGASVMCHVDLLTEEELDDCWKKALEKDAKCKMALEMQFWGAKYGQFTDPWGIIWAVSTYQDDGDGDGVPPAKTKKLDDA